MFLLGKSNTHCQKSYLPCRRTSAEKSSRLALMNVAMLTLSKTGQQRAACIIELKIQENLWPFSKRLDLALGSAQASVGPVGCFNLRMLVVYALRASDERERSLRPNTKPQS